MKFETEDGTVISDVSFEAVREQLDRLSSNGNSFAILSSSNEDYLQTAWIDQDAFTIERRDGSKRLHWRAEPLAERPKATTPRPFWMRLATPFSQEKYPVFTKIEVQQVFQAYLQGNDVDHLLRWTRIRL